MHMYQSICFSGHFPSWNGSRFSVNNTVDSQKTCRSTGNMLFLSHYDIHRDAAQHAACFKYTYYAAFYDVIQNTHCSAAYWSAVYFHIPCTALQNSCIYSEAYFWMQKKYMCFPANILENKLERKAIRFNFFYLTYSGQGSDFNRVCSKKAINILR